MFIASSELTCPFKPFSKTFAMQKNKTVLAFLDDVYEDLELWYPKLRLEEIGYTLKCAGQEIKTYAGKQGYPAASMSTLPGQRHIAALQIITSAPSPPHAAIADMD